MSTPGANIPGVSEEFVNVEVNGVAVKYRYVMCIQLRRVG